MERPVTGDRVLWLPTAGRRGVVVALEPRGSVLARPDAGGGARPVAANLDRLAVVVASEPPCPPPLIDRYLVAAEHFNLRALLVVNKADLMDEAGWANLLRSLAAYEAVGYPLCRASARLPGGVAALADRLRGHTTVLVGPSGVGKSSLVRALVPGASAAVGEVSRATRLGRHTTSTSTLFHLPGGGGDLIDSPGVRDFGLWHLPDDAIARGFVEIRALAGECRFRDCRHRGEPGCAVEAGVAAGKVSPARLASYREILAATARG
jgi:ribosome biogenesis GTPase